MFDLLKKYTEISGPVGHEDRVQKTFSEDIKQNVESIQRTRTGNVIAHIPGEGRKVVIFGHADEICYYVRGITEEGFLRIVPYMPRTERINFPYAVVGQRVFVIGDSDDYRGVIVSKSGHLLTEVERSKSLEYTDLLCDIGTDTLEEVEAKGIHVGSPIVWNVPTEQLGDKIFGKAMDDRIAHAIEVELSKRLKGVKLNCDLYLGSTTQEELGLKGASDLSRGGYEVSIAIDIGIAGDYPVLEKGRSNIKLGAGPAIVWKDSSAHYNVELIKELQDSAKRAGVSFQHALFTGYGSDASEMIGGGSMSALIAPPCRYSHQPHEMIHIKDIESTVELLYNFVTKN